ncbi:tetraspanin-2 [Ambystoma mexicanum]|uniref:tetraspanin-2 n=1 Tax=Ambystoma mexicanum TaxID=8296 RepID=UPI0037E72668
MGRVSGTMRCIKYLLCAFNFVFWLTGSAVIAIGLWLRFGADISELALQGGGSLSSYFTGLYILIAAGTLMMIVGFFGCCGAARESQCLLGSFFASLLVIFAAEMTAGLFVFIGKNAAVEEFQDMYRIAYEENKKGIQGSNETLIVFHKILDCCGEESDEEVKSLCPPDLKERRNCVEEIEKQISAKLKIIGIVAITIAGITIFGMIFSMVLCCAIRNSREII